MANQPPRSAVTIVCIVDKAFAIDPEYEYDVDGETFQSSNVTLDGLLNGTHAGSGKAQAEEVLSRYPIGTQVGIHFDPEDPERATLQTGVSLNNFLVPIFALVLTVIGSAWLLFIMFSRTGQDEQWSGKERACPKCHTTFNSVQDKGVCPKCHHAFFASEVMSFPRGT